MHAGQGYKVIAVDIKQSSIDLASSYRWKPDVSVLATDPAENAVRRISEVVPGRYPGVDAAILATDGPRLILPPPARKSTASWSSSASRTRASRCRISSSATCMQLVGSLIADKKQAEDMRKVYLDGKSDGKNVIVFG
ncbi:Alcohol dehydrogenase zinc-type [Cordyceps militaris]|uniref:Alcohol dehydrogenase zinc-type n=1 Tax=Cordyceps militaris TaxID=73501 RepID=A0A2H4SHH6_CORMI|nr:Alcohol dehydrogenase zinc-type [Cordyceps militaris]